MTTHDKIELLAGSLSVTYCRTTGAWTVTCAGYDDVVRGNGLADYHALLGHLAAGSADSLGDIEFLSTLGGHRHEVAA